MARKLASIVEIEDCVAIPETEKLAITTMTGKGWKVVTSRDEFSPGDLAIYFEIDSFLPDTDERYAFLKERCLRKIVSKSGAILYQGIRIKTLKLRGVISQGLLMPIGCFPEVNELIKDICPVNLIGQDITTLLKIEHYDEVCERFRPSLGGGSATGDFKGKFPSAFIPKTDEERIQNLSEWFDKYRTEEWEVTSKDDGSSLTMFYSPLIDVNEPFGICSRNNWLKDGGSGGLCQMGFALATEYGVHEKLKAYYEKNNVELALQGELVGPGIQSDRDKYTKCEWHIFKIYDITNQKYLLPPERQSICRELNLPHVEIVNPSIKVFELYPTMEALLQYAEGKTARGNEREGLVFKSMNSSLSFKAVSNRYLMKTID